MEIKEGDLVEIGLKGDAVQDLMYAGFKAKVKDMYPGGQAFIVLDDYTRETGQIQAVSGSTLWPVGRLRKVQAT